jgi:glycosyltransferase involved in cell wall biosynthesis
MENSLPFVSVIIPAYKTAAYIKEAVDSALAQTYSNVEVIVVDDGSPDGLHEILHPYIDARRIIYIHQTNAGLAAARNTGIRRAQGEFIALLDSDDAFLPAKLERQVGYLVAHPECAVSYCDIFHFYDGEPENLLRLNYEYYSGADVFPALLRKNFINPLSVVLRRSVFGTVGYFDEAMKQFAEDWDFWLRAAHAGLRFDHLPETLARYRMRKTSISYSSSLEVTRKRTVIGIFERLNAAMSPVEREKYGIPAILLRHRLRLWYAELAKYFPPLTWMHHYIQKRRLARKSA